MPKNKPSAMERAAAIRAELVAKVRQLIADHPKAAVAVVREWMRDNTRGFSTTEMIVTLIVAVLFYSMLIGALIVWGESHYAG